jgi:O-antigen/teichoic acid export membrane protein
LSLYSKNRARKSLFATIGFRGLSQLATVFSYIVLVRALSEQAFGVLNLLYAFIPFFTTVGSLGLDQTLRRFQPEYLRKGEQGNAAWLARSVRLTRFLSNLILIALVLAAWNWIAPWFQLGPYRGDFLVFGVLILLYFQVNIFQFSLASHMLHQYSVGSVAILSLAKLLIYAVLAWLGQLNLRNAIVADTLAYGAAYGFLWLAYRRVGENFASAATAEASPLAARRPDRPELSRMGRFAAFSHLNDSTSLLVYSETDRFFIAGLMNPLAVGAYAFYTRLNEMAGTLIPLKLFDNLVQPLFFSVPAEEARAKLPRYFTLLVNLNLAYQLPLIAMTAVYHHEIVGLFFGGKFIEHSTLLALVVLYATTNNVFAVPLTLVAQYRERAALILSSNVWSVWQVAAMLLLVPRFGLAGAATATGTFNLLRNLYVWWQVRDDAVWLNMRSVLLLSVVIWAPAIGLCLAVRDANLSSVVNLLCGMLICGIAALIHVRSPAICDSDRRVLSNLLHGRERMALRLAGLLPGRS